MKKNILLLAIVVVIVVVVVIFTDIQSVDEYYLSNIDNITEDSETVFISIDCSLIFDNYDQLQENLKSEEFVPSDGVILEQKEYVLRPGDSVFDVLDRVTKHNRIQMEYSGSIESKTIYIKGLNHLYEFSCGPLSGWIYKVNGEIVSYSCSQYQLKDGDIIEWVYSCNVGNDVLSSVLQ